MKNLPAPKVFISYSWSSDEHAEWVLDLAKRLRSNGVDVILDRWHLKNGQDKYKFMEQAVTDPTVVKVLMICDRLYAEKADARRGGVGDETQIISPEIYKEVDQTKFLPVIAERNDKHQPYKPSYLQARMHIDLSQLQMFEKGYEDLLRDIFEKPIHTPPPLGQPPTFLFDDAKPQRQTTYNFMAFKSALMNNRPTAVGLAEDYLNQLLLELQEYNLTGTSAGAGNIKEELLARVADSLAHRDEYIDFIWLLSRWANDQRLFATVQRFFAAAAKFITSLSNQESSSYQAYRLIVPELFLYTHAALIAFGHYHASAALLSQTYTVGDVSDPYSRVRSYDYVLFSPYLDVLEKDSQFAIFDTASPTAQLLIERATNTTLTKTELLNADYVLYARQMLKPSMYTWGNWRGVTRPYLGYLSGPMPFFLDARSRANFAASKVILSVADKAELVKCFQESSEKNSNATRNSYRPDWIERDTKLMGIDLLDTQ